MYNGLSKDVNIINILYFPENSSKNLTKNHPLIKVKYNERYKISWPGTHFLQNNITCKNTNVRAHTD